MNSIVSLRPAQPDDAMTAASLIRLSMNETADLFADGESGLTPEKIFTALFTRKGGRFSYQVGTMLEADGAPAGLLMSYPVSTMMMLNLITGRNLLSILGLRAMIGLAKRMLPMMSVHEAERGEYHIGNIGVLPSFQGNGYGARLLSFAEEQAHQLGLKKCSLTVDQHNDGAIRLYQRFGYKIVHTGRFSGGHSGEHRMVKELA